MPERDFMSEKIEEARQRVEASLRAEGYERLVGPDGVERLCRYGQPCPLPPHLSEPIIVRALEEGGGDECP